MTHFPESETVTETTVFTRTVSHGNQLERFQRVLSSARQKAASLGMEFLVTLVDDMNAALAADESASADAQTRVNNTIQSASDQIAALQAELAAAQGLAVTQSMIDKVQGLANTIGQIDPAAVPAPTPAPPVNPTGDGSGGGTAAGDGTPAAGGPTAADGGTAAGDGTTPPAFTQGTDGNGNPMTDPTTGLPVDQSGQPNPNA